MRNKLFFAFLAVVLTALISNLLYEYFVTRDFEDYVSGAKEDKLYWVLASVEGSYEKGHWNKVTLHEAIHWAIMLGFDIKVLDSEKKELVNSDMVLSMLSPAMKRRMKNIGDIKTTTGDFESFPLYYEGAEIGTMLAREMGRPSSVVRKEMLFKRRGKEFLIMSFAIAGGGAVLLSIFFTLFLSRPLKKMRDAVVTMAHRDFSVRLPVVSRDEMGSLSESFNFMAEALEREEALRKHLTSNIAHELRTPLSIMKANVEAMLDGVIEDKVTGIKNIQAEVEKLIRLVQGIEDITKAEASFFARKDYKLVELREFLSTIVQKIKPLASAKGLEMIITETKDLSVYTDSDKLERVLQNILSNAIKHTKKEASASTTGQMETCSSSESATTGAGIERNALELIFRRFYHGADSTGLGLGLSIVKELLEVMGGSIDVESRKEEGSRFTIRLPKDPGLRTKN